MERDDDALLRALREGDERVFSQLVERWSGVMLRLALSHVERRAIAEEVVQDAWLTMLRSLDRFERRSTVRTWVLGIVINLARSRARAERRSMSFADERGGPAVHPTRFLPESHPRWPRHWAVEPIPWRTPEDDLLAGEARQVLLQAIDALPAAQREVVVLRDLEGLPAADVCHILGLTDTNQRVLLHRARSRVRGALERYYHPSLHAPRVGDSGAAASERMTDSTLPELSCRELVELVTDYFEDRLSPAERARFEAHLAGCEACQIYLEQFRQTIRALGRLPEESLSADARAALLAAFRGWSRP